jgi:putative ABC transport system permease protein
MESLFQDLRYCVRVLRTNVGFTIVAVVTLALGIGANTAIFSVVNAVLLRPLPFREPDRLTLLWQTDPRAASAQLPFSFPNFTDVKQQSQSLEAVAAWTAYSDTRFNLVGSGEPEQLQAARVSQDFFPTLGVEPVLGRNFVEEEDRENGPRAVILGNELWQRRFGGDPHVLGNALNFDGNSYTVIGIMPPGFAFPKFPKPAEVWVALSRDPDPTMARKYARGANYLGVLARLKDGVSVPQVQSEIDTIASRLREQYPHENAQKGFVAIPLQQQASRDLRPALLVLLGAVGFVLLISCANVASLLLVRATARRREIAVRLALGSSRARIIRQLLTESLLLSVMGGAVGLLLALWGVDLLRSVPYNAPSFLAPYRVAPEEIGLSGAVLGFTLFITLMTGVAFGLVPALQASKPDVNEALKDSSTTAQSFRMRFRGALVIAEIAISLVLLTGAGLMVKSFLRLLDVDPGFQPENVLTAEINLSKSEYASDQRIAGFYQQVIERIAAIPGVRSAGAASMLPLSGADQGSDFFIEGQPPPDPGQKNEINYQCVSPDYFRTMGITVLEGRPFSERDNPDSPRVAMINESAARLFWSGQDPVGKRLGLSLEALRFPSPDRPPVFDIPGAMREIVGVVKDVRHDGLNIQPQPEMFIPYGQRPAREMTIVARCVGDPSQLASLVRSEVRAINPNQPIAAVNTMPDLVSRSIAKPRFNFIMLGVFATVALVLATVGVYGVMAFSVAQRTREIGIRFALGAQPRQVTGMVVGEGMRLIAAGIGLGLAAALALTRVMTALLFGVSPTDPATFAGVSLLLSMVALMACYIPARRASTVDPIETLRYE